MLPHVPGVQMQRKIDRFVCSTMDLRILAIPDDIMDVDRGIDEDRDNDSDKVSDRCWHTNLVYECGYPLAHFSKPT